MTTDTHTTFDLPTEAEYAAVEEIVSCAQEAVEKMSWRLAPLLNPERTSIPSPPVTAADIGLLWSFLEIMQLDVGAIRRDVKNGVKPALGYLNAHRLAPEDSARAPSRKTQTSRAQSRLRTGGFPRSKPCPTTNC